MFLAVVIISVSIILTRTHAPVKLQHVWPGHTLLSLLAVPLGGVMFPLALGNLPGTKDVIGCLIATSLAIGDAEPCTIGHIGSPLVLGY